MRLIEIIFLPFLNIGISMSIHYYTNFKFEKIIFGGEHLIKDYVTLANDPTGNLPDSYTMCTSVFVKYSTSDVNIIEMLKQDGSHWYLLELSATNRNYDKFSESMQISVVNPTTGKDEWEVFTNAVIQIVAHSWYHVCMGLNTVSGLLRIVVNGIEVVNEEKEYFRDTITMKPGSLEGKVLMFKEHHIGLHLNNRGMFTNMNIFASMMSVNAMIQRTSGGESCFDPGDYLRCVITQ